MTKQAVLKLIETDGPISSQEIASVLKITINHARAVVCYLKNRLKAIRIHSYRRDEEYGRMYPRALYVLGHARNPPKPGPLDSSEYRKRHYARKKAIGATSVFAAAVPVDKRRLTTRKRPDVPAYLTKPRGPSDIKYVGVFNHNGRYQARIRVDYVTVYLGTFTTAEEARDVYQAAVAERALYEQNERGTAVEAA